MTSDTTEKSLQVYARLAGFMYLVILAVAGPGDSLMASFQVRGDFAATAANIEAGELLYRTSLAMQLFGGLAVVLLGGALYVVLKEVDRHLALFALLWWVAEGTLGAVYTLFMFLALNVYTGGAGAFIPEQQLALASLMRQGEIVGFTLAAIFFSVGSIVVFYLLLRSRIIPRVLAGFGLLASLLTTVLGFAKLIAPALETQYSGLWIAIVIAEATTGLWLLIMGANFRWWSTRASADQPSAD